MINRRCAKSGVDILVNVQKCQKSLFFDQNCYQKTSQNGLSVECLYVFSKSSLYESRNIWNLSFNDCVIPFWKFWIIVVLGECPVVRLNFDMVFLCFVDRDTRYHTHKYPSQWYLPDDQIDNFDTKHSIFERPPTFDAYTGTCRDIRPYTHNDTRIRFACWYELNNSLWLISWTKQSIGYSLFEILANLF